MLYKVLGIIFEKKSLKNSITPKINIPLQIRYFSKYMWYVMKRVLFQVADTSMYIREKEDIVLCI